MKKQYRCSNCYYSVFFEIKKEYDLDECPICFENFCYKRKRYFTCYQFVCGGCALNDISKCPLCREGQTIKIEKFGYFNIISQHLMEKVNHLNTYKHLDILRYLEWLYAAQHVNKDILGIPNEFDFMNIWQDDISNIRYSKNISHKMPIFCRNKKGFIHRFYQTYEVYSQLFNQLPLIKDEIKMPFFMNNKYLLFVKRINGDVVYLGFNEMDTIGQLKVKIYDLINVPENTQQLIYAGKRYKDNEILFKHHDMSTFQLITMCSGD